MSRNRGMNRRVVWGLALLALLVGAMSGAFWWRGASGPSGFERGLAAYDRKDYAEAEKRAREWIKTHPDDVIGVRLLIRSLYRQGRDETANAFLKRLSETSFEAEDFFLMGMAYIRQADPQSAILAWRRALGRDPANVETLGMLNDAMSRLDLLSEAARAARSLAEIPGSRSRGSLLLARALIEQGDYPAARDALRIALEKPEEWSDRFPVADIRRLLARQLLRTGDPDGARGALLDIPGGQAEPETAWLLARCDLAQAKPSEPAIAAASQAYREAHPTEHEPAPYLGEASCAKCHAGISQVQHNSRHARTFPRQAELERIPYPKSPIPDPGNAQVTHEFLSKDGLIVEKTKVKNQVFETVVEYAFGSGDRGLTLVGRNADHKYLEMRMSYYAPPIGWDVTSGHPNDPAIPAGLYPGMTLTIDAVWRCLVCHATHPQAVLAKDGPEALDRAIGCEQCHGPAGHHPTAVANHDPDLALARLTATEGPSIVAVCASCHAPRSKDLRLSPGSPDAVRFQGTTLTWSRCYSESSGALDCVTCHNPHQDVETNSAWYESRCLNCHAAPVAKKRSTPSPADEHAANRPCPVNPTAGCVSCHMPKVNTTMAHAAFTDHFIRARKPENEPAAGDHARADTRPPASPRVDP